MQISEQVESVCNEIASRYSPQSIILFSCKRNIAGEIGSFKLCVVMDTGDKHEAERRIYLDVDSECPYDVLVYTPEEWQKHTSELHSFAHRVKEKGTVIYGKTV